MMGGCGLDLCGSGREPGKQLLASEGGHRAVWFV